jgi:predicted transglutaminase-like cysteine proteinase
MTQEKSARTAPRRFPAYPGRLRRMFAGSLMLATLNCAGTLRRPAAISESTPAGEKQSAADPCARDSGGLIFTFENADKPKLFGSETKGVFNNDSSNAEEKWFAMLGRHTTLMQNPANAAAYNAWMSQLIPELQAIVAERHATVDQATVAEKAKAVDALVDRTIKYASDKDLYGPPGAPDDYDYWASPMETITKKHKDKDGRAHAGWGDCDDFGFLKYFGLRYLGVPAEKIYAVYVDFPSTDAKDKGKDKKLGHIMTMVDITEMSGGAQHFIILNNDGSAHGNLEEESVRKEYRPLYAFNEKGPLSFPANITAWGGPGEQPAVCLPAVRPPQTAPSSRTP